MPSSDFVSPRPLARALEVPLQEVHFWTDSQNVLGWIRNASRHFKPFVANRVGKIHRVTEPSQWQHVATKSNPADLLTRGLTATQLAECDLWWNGPPFLVEPGDAWPAGPVQPGRLRHHRDEASDQRPQSSDLPTSAKRPQPLGSDEIFRLDTPGESSIVGHPLHHQLFVHSRTSNNG